jgi:TonB family protein
MLSRTQGANSLDLYIKKIHSVFEMHNVTFGSPEDLPVFITKLRENRHLAMDFWALTAAISRHEGPDLPNEQMLEIIVRGTTGKDAEEIRDSGEEQKQAIDDLCRMLRGEDIDNPLAQSEEPWPPPPRVEKPPVNVFSRIRSVEVALDGPEMDKSADKSAAHKKQTVKENQSLAEKPAVKEKQSLAEMLAVEEKQSLAEEPAVEEDRPLAERPVVEETPSRQQADSLIPEEDVVLEDRAPQPEAEEADLRDDLPSSASPTLSKRALDEALVRLKRNSLELKRHLAEIDSRISLIEPRLGELASNDASGPKSQRSPIRVSPPAPDLYFSAKDVQLRSRRTEENQRLVLRAADSAEDDPPIPIPLDSYARGRGKGSLGWFVLLLMLAGLFFLQHRFGSSVWRQYGSQVQQVVQLEYAKLAQAWRNIKTASVTAQPTASSSENASTPASSPPQAPTAPVADSKSAHDAAPQREPEGPNAAGNGTAPAQAPPSAPAFVTTPSTARVENPQSDLRSRRSSREREPEEAPDYTSPAAAAESSEVAVNVPASVMQENLITSRVPAYPDTAKADGVQGSVVMRAVISKYGTVNHLHVIQGDPMLQSAAQEAVSKWRYRPYTLNGRPVEVATTVKVDFRLPTR